MKEREMCENREMCEIDLTQTSHLSQMTAEGLSRCLDFLYTAEVSLDMDVVLDVLRASHYLQLSVLLGFCCRFLKEQITDENLVQIAEIAKFFSLGEINAAITEYILKNFDKLLESQTIVKLAFEDLRMALKDSRLRAKELKIFYAAHLWLTHDPERIQHAADLMSTVRFQLIEPENIEDLSAKISYMNDDFSCMKLILEAQKYHMLPFKQPIFAGTGVMQDRANIRCEEPVLLALGGKESTNQVSNSVQYFCEKKKRWQPLTTMPTAAYCHCVAVLNDFLFVVGGQEMFDNNGNTATANTFRYDPRFDCWKQLQPMLEPRTDFHLSVLNSDSLVAVAGRNQSGPLSSCEKYVVEKNKWEPISSLPISVCAHAGATVDGDLYIAGGFASDGFQRGCYRITQKNGDYVWETRAPLNVERGLHCMVEVIGKLYVIGGNNKTNGYRRDVQTTEVYDPEINQWTELSPLFEGQSEAGAAVVNNLIYVVGGHTWRERKDVRTVASYDTDRDYWSKNNDFPEALTSVACCSIKVPSYLNEGDFLGKKMQTQGVNTGPHSSNSSLLNDNRIVLVNASGGGGQDSPVGRSSTFANLTSGGI